MWWGHAFFILILVFWTSLLCMGRRNKLHFIKWGSKRFLNLESLAPGFFALNMVSHMFQPGGRTPVWTTQAAVTKSCARQKPDKLVWWSKLLSRKDSHKHVRSIISRQEYLVIQIKQFVKSLHNNLVGFRIKDNRSNRWPPEPSWPHFLHQNHLPFCS